MDKKTIKINFVDTERGYFNNEDNIFLDILKEHYNIEYVFCDRKNSGKIIKELLEKGND